MLLPKIFDSIDTIKLKFGISLILMNIDTKAQNLPNLIMDWLGKDGVNINNLFANYQDVIDSSCIQQVDVTQWSRG